MARGQLIAIAALLVVLAVGFVVAAQYALAAAAIGGLGAHLAAWVSRPPAEP